MPGLEHPVPRALGRDRTAEELPREPDREIADVDHLLYLAEALLGDLPGLERDQRAERLLLLAQLFAEQADELAATGRGNVPPALEGGGGTRDGGVRAGRVRAAQVGEQLAVDRRAHGEIAFAEERAVEADAVKDVIDGEHGEPPSGPRRRPGGLMVP